MIRFVPLAFVASLLIVGCTAPAHLTHTSELSQDEKMQQTIAVWKDTHISKAIQKWGSPNEVSDDGTGWQTYIWQIPVHGFLAGQEGRMPGFHLRQDHQIHPRRRPQWHAGSRWNIHINRLYLPTHVLHASKRYNLQNRHKKGSRPRK